MVYNWEGKEAECYRLYVEEKRSLDEVIEYWEQRGFTPSKRAFQSQFKKWEFPSKQNPAYRNTELIARVKELWEKNTTQRDMVGILQDEGFQINDRELLRVRLRFNWLLREHKGKLKRPRKTAKATAQEENVTGDDEPLSPQEEHAHAQDGPVDAPGEDDDVPQPLDPQEALRRQIRLEQLQIESVEKWRARKRRRRTRGWAGLPADAPGEPPRFPSETTLDESKAFLGLGNDLYRQVRDQFQVMCEEEGVIKKTIAGPEKWTQLKHRLVRENEHLSGVFAQDPDAQQQIGTLPTPTNQKALSLDVICTDVTKRMRTTVSKMTLPEAKNALGLNPTETRAVRATFHDILKADHFTNKYEAGDEHWNNLKRAWHQSTPLLAQALALGDTDPKQAEKLKATEVIARDVMKRLRAENHSKDPSRKKQINLGPGPGPAPPTVVPSRSRRQTKDTQNVSASQTPTSSLDLPLLSKSDFQIDPSLLLAASDPSLLPDLPFSHSPDPPHHQNTHPTHHGSATTTTSTHPHYIPPAPLQPPPPPLFPQLPLPIYFRLHPHSHSAPVVKTIWLSILHTISLHELRTLALREHPGTDLVQIEGLVTTYKTGGGQPDKEVLLSIDDDDELGAFLQHVGGGKASFVVLLAVAGGQGGGGFV